MPMRRSSPDRGAVWHSAWAKLLGTAGRARGSKFAGRVPFSLASGTSQTVPARSSRLFRGPTSRARLHTARGALDLVESPAGRTRDVLDASVRAERFGIDPSPNLMERSAGCTARPRRLTVPECSGKPSWQTARAPCVILACPSSLVRETDPLVSALEELRLRCVLVKRAPGAGAWTVAFPVDAISLHLVLRGEYLIDADVKVWRYLVHTDELLVVKRGVGGGLRAISDVDLAEVLSACVHLEAPLGHPLLESLPRLIRTTSGYLPRSFGPSVHALREELSIPVLGAEIVLGRLCEVLFVQALRDHIRDLAWNDQGWFRMLADPLLREQLVEASRPSGSVASFARALGRSRQRTRARFTQFGGTSPSAFQRQARVRLAAELLRSGETDLVRVATTSGFGSQQALSRAFRRELGTSPAAHWRSVHHRPFPRRAGRTEQEDS